MKKIPFIVLILCAVSFAQTNVARMLSGVNAQTGTSYTFVASDVTKVVTFNNVGSVSATLLAGSTTGFGAGSVFTAVNLGAGTVTIVCSGCTINGSASIQVVQNQSVNLYGDGANYVSASGSGAGAANFASPPPLGNTTPNSVAGTVVNIAGSGLFFSAQPTCLFGESDNTLDEFEDVGGIPMWLPQGALGPCSQFLTYTPLPVGITPTDKQVVAYNLATNSWTVQSQVGGGGSVSAQANGVIPLATGATSIGAQSHLDDGNTTPGAITSSEPFFAPNIGSSVPGIINLNFSYSMSCATVNGNGASTTTNGTITSGSTSILLTSATGFAAGQGVFIVGAGAASGPYNGIVLSVASNTITVNVATGTTVTGAQVFNYSAPAQTTTNGTVGSSSTVIPVLATATFLPNQGIYIKGAGAGGANYVGTVQSVNAGVSITVTPATSTSVTNAVVQHDETASLNNAIAGLVNGTINGTLYPPSGICLFNGPLQRQGDADAIIPLPNIPYNPNGVFTGVNGPTLSITIQGATVPSWSNYNLNGWSSIPTSIGTIFQTSVGAGNFIGAQNTNEADLLTAVHLTLQDLVFRTVDNPNITMVNAFYCIGLTVHDALFDTLANGAQSFPSQPTHTNGQGLVVPISNNDAQNFVRDVRISGYYTAMTWGEHINVDHAILYANNQGILCNYPANSHSNWAGYVDIENNAYGIVASGSSCPIWIGLLDTEFNNVPSWVSSSTNHAQIYDPNNLLHGKISVGLKTYFTRYGGNNLQIEQLADPNAAAGNLTWVPGFIGPTAALGSTTVGSPNNDIGTKCSNTHVFELTLPKSPATNMGQGCVTLGFNFAVQTVTVRVPSVLTPNANAYTSFNIGTDGTHFVEMYVGNTTLGYQYKNGAGFVSVATVTYNPATMLWWQFSESGGTVTAKYSGDGINFTTLGSVVPGFTYTAANIGFEVDCLTACATYEGRAIFDNFSIGTVTNPVIGNYTIQDGLFGSNQQGQASACEVSFAATTLATGATTTDTTNNCLPANAVIDSVVYRITTTITTAANFTIGDPTTAARFCGTQSTLTAGTTGICFVQADQTGAAGPRQTAAAKVRVTANVNPGAGAIRLIVYYHTWTAPTS